MKRRVLFTAALIWVFGIGSGMAIGPPVAKGEMVSCDTIAGRQETRTDTLITSMDRYSGVDLPELSHSTEEKDTLKKKGFFHKILDYFEDSNEDKTFDKKFDFSIIGGPHYSSDTKLGLGLVAAGLFRVDRTDSITPPSNISLYSDFATTGFYLIGIRGNTFFQQAKYRFDYKTYFFSMPSDFWGIGYDMGKDDDNRTSYKRKQTAVKLDFMYELARDFYGGVTFDFNHIEGAEFKRPELLGGQKQKYTNKGFGLFVLYDSRDVVTAPYRGWFFKLESIIYPKFMGNRPNFGSYEFTLNYYHPVWKGGVMAYDLHSRYNTGETPWTMLPRLGGSHRMRGYYEGRYQDDGLLEFQAELRQRVWRRIGFTTWIGAGNVFSKISKLKMKQTLPNGGIGLRWEFKNRVNVRLDYGFGKKQSGFIFNINEAF